MVSSTSVENSRRMRSCDCPKAQRDIAGCGVGSDGQELLAFRRALKCRKDILFPWLQRCVAGQRARVPRRATADSRPAQRASGVPARVSERSSPKESSVTIEELVFRVLCRSNGGDDARRQARASAHAPAAARRAPAVGEIRELARLLAVQPFQLLLTRGRLRGQPSPSPAASPRR